MGNIKINNYYHVTKKQIDVPEYVLSESHVLQSSAFQQTRGYQ